MFWFLAACFFSAVVSFYLYRKFCCHRFFKQAGIPGPEPHWLFGNTHQLFCEDRHLVIARWSAEYGQIFGYFLGGEPVLVVSTADLVEKVCVKQFSDFQGHLVLPIAPDPDVDKENTMAHMLFAKGETWKRLRTICNPAFSSGKLKSYTPLLTKCETDLMELFSERAKSGETFDIRELFQYLTLEVIGNVGFGLEFDAIKSRGEGNVILQKMRAFLKSSTNPPSIIKTSLYLTELTFVFKAFIFAQMKLLAGFFAPVGYLAEVVRKIIKKRREPNSRRNDILQNMIDVCSEDPNTNKINELSSFKSLSETEMIAQCLLLFVAGYETTSTSLGFASYLLAKNPDVQEKLASEIAEKFPRSNNKNLPEPEYQTIMNEMPYLDWTCRETLRLYPVGLNVFTRFVMNETSLCGFNIPKETLALVVDTWTIHHDETLWGPVDTETFYPERFSPENSANRPDSAFLPFGFGPRQCLGMRLALLEMKMTLTNILLRFRIVEPEGGYPGGKLPISSTNGPLLPTMGVPVRLIPRN